MLNALFIFLSLFVFLLCHMREKKSQKQLKCADKIDNVVWYHDLEEHVKEWKEKNADQAVLVKQLEEEQNVLLHHLKEAVTFSDQMKDVHSFANKKIIRLEKELADKNLENQKCLEKLKKKDILLLQLSEQKQQYRKERDKIKKDTEGFLHQIAVLQGEIKNWQIKFNTLEKQLKEKEECVTKINFVHDLPYLHNSDSCLEDGIEDLSVETRL